MKENEAHPVLAMNFIILLLGMVLITEFYSFLVYVNLSPKAWIGYLNHLQHYVQVNSFRFEVLEVLKNTAPLSQILFLVGLFISALACIALFARFYICLFISFAFFVVWVLNLQAPERWSYDFLFPALFALLVGLSMRHFSLAPQAIFSQLGTSFIIKLIAIGTIACFLYYVTFISFDDSLFSHKVGLYSAFTFFILCLLFNLRKQQNTEQDSQGSLNRYQDYMIIILGSMLVMQVWANYFSGLFQFDFKNSLLEFASATNTIWIRGVLEFGAQYSQWILPFYILFETALSICLSLLLLRVPVLFATSALLGVLAFSEFGVSSTWPPTPHNLTWEWQLLIAFLVALIIAIEKTIQLKHHFSWKYLIFGDPISQKPIKLYIIPFIAILCGLGLYFVCMATQIFGASYQSTALYAGLSFGVLILILLIMDKFRRAKPQNRISHKRTNNSLGS